MLYQLSYRGHAFQIPPGPDRRKGSVRLAARDNHHGDQTDDHHGHAGNHQQHP